MRREEKEQAAFFYAPIHLSPPPVYSGLSPPLLTLQGLSHLMFIHLPLKGRTQHPVKTKSSPFHDMILLPKLKGPQSEGGLTLRTLSQKEGDNLMLCSPKKPVLSALLVIKAANGGEKYTAAGTQRRSVGD